MNEKWIKVRNQLPPEELFVDTKIHDENGDRNHAVLMYKDDLWFLRDSSLAVHYAPSHWKLKE